MRGECEIANDGILPAQRIIIKEIGYQSYSLTFLSNEINTPNTSINFTGFDFKVKE